jgi:succinylarginine dihydrolase
VLNKDELEAFNGNVLLSDSLYEKLSKWIDKHYRDKMTHEDLSDPVLLNENRTALDELTQITQVGSVYAFQLA